jgi:hypothetical protein
MGTLSAIEAALRDAEEIELVTRGRRSGRPHAVTLWSAYDGGVLWLRGDADADWYRNLRADPRCRIRVNAMEVAGTREDVADEDVALRRLVELWRAKYGPEWVGDWYVERGRIPVRVRVALAR